MKKLIFALIVIAALLIVAMPAAAQGPNPFKVVFYDRTAQMDAAWAGDPFGGNPRVGADVKYEPDATGKVVLKINGAAWPYSGITAKYGWEPFNPLLPGGVPSSKSGDGSGPRRAIYIGGAWADDSVNPANCYGVYDNICRQRNEVPYELPACALTKIPAGSSKWFKLDTWRTRDADATRGTAGSRVRTQIWLDDELDTAKVPSGKAAFGAANKWFLGAANGDGWSGNAFWGANAQDAAEINGYFMAVYDPDVLQPNFAFAPPNAWIFTLDVSGSGGLRRSCTSAAYAGQPCVQASKGGPSSNAGISLSITASPDGVNAGQAIKGFGQFNPNQPSHLLWYEGNWDGWVFLRVWNQMIWDGTVSVCSYRQVGN